MSHSLPDPNVRVNDPAQRRCVAKELLDRITELGGDPYYVGLKLHWAQIPHCTPAELGRITSAIEGVAEEFKELIGPWRCPSCAGPAPLPAYLCDYCRAGERYPVLGFVHGATVVHGIDDRRRYLCRPRHVVPPETAVYKDIPAPIDHWGKPRRACRRCRGELELRAFVCWFNSSRRGRP